MKAIHVTSFGGPEVLRLADVPDPSPARDRCSCVSTRPASIRLTPTSAPAPTRARRRFRISPGSTARASSKRSVRVSRPGARRSRVDRSARAVARHLRRAHGVRPRAGLRPSRARLVRGWRVARRTGGDGPPSLFGRADARAGDTVLVHGASGAVGIAAVQLARDAGLRVFGTASSEAGRALVVRRAPRRRSIITTAHRVGGASRPHGRERRRHRARDAGERRTSTPTSRCSPRAGVSWSSAAAAASRSIPARPWAKMPRSSGWRCGMCRRTSSPGLTSP